MSLMSFPKDARLLRRGDFQEDNESWCKGSLSLGCSACSSVKKQWLSTWDQSLASASVRRLTIVTR